VIFCSSQHTSPAHFINLLFHIGAGVIALVLGFAILAKHKGTAAHKRLGKLFFYFTLAVTFFAGTGVIFFRFLPIFAVLDVLVLYQLIGGWRQAQTQEQGPAGVDALITLLAWILSLFLAPVLLGASSDSLSVMYSTLGGLFGVLLYDTVRWLFPRHWYLYFWFRLRLTVLELAKPDSRPRTLALRTYR
jgi:uncharacterized membrane protein